MVVLRDVDFELRSGEVHALVGENGSGKSTLVKILTGAQRPSVGHLFMDDDTVDFSSPAEAQRRGIGVVHQDYNLFPDLTVAENVFGIASLPRRRWSRAVDKGKVEERVETIFRSLDIEIPPGVVVRTLGPAERKFVEIARAMLGNPRFLILDEPTASLEPRASRSVLSLVRRLRAQGVGLAFVSHRLDEVCQIADRVTVLRDGGLIGRPEGGSVREELLAELIVGAKRRALHERRSQPGAALLRLHGVRLAPNGPSIRLDARRGEILGCTGLLGSGAAALVRMIGGAEPLRGHAEIDGTPVRIRTPREAKRHGIGFIPEDRKALGLVQDQSVAINISLASLESVSTGGIIRWGKVTERAEEQRMALDIRASSTLAAVKTLSGGNMQKVMLAKWLASGVRLLAIEEPTHGIDVGGKAQVHDLLRAFADGGGTIVVATTDAEEALKLCDRIAIFRHGAVTHMMATDELTNADVTLLGAKDAEHYLEALIESGDAAPQPA